MPPFTVWATWNLEPRIQWAFTLYRSSLLSSVVAYAPVSTLDASLLISTLTLLHQRD